MELRGVGAGTVYLPYSDAHT